MKSLSKDNSGSIGTVFTMVLIIGMMGFLMVATGFMYEFVKDMNNDMITNDEYYSQDRRDAMDTLFQIRYIFPILIILLIFAFAVINAIRARSGEVS